MNAHTLFRPRLPAAAVALAGVLAAMLAGATSPAAAQGRDTVGANTTDAIGKPGALTALETTALNAMRDRNIAAHLILEDSSEAALSQPVSEIAHLASVRAFATMLAADHTRALDRDRALVPALRGLPRLSAADTTDPRMLRTMDMRFRGVAPDSALDRIFVTAQLVHHVHLLNELGTLRAIAMAAPVQRRIDDEMAIVRTHLERGQALARSMGLPAP